jgi:hypothetical protein
MREEHIYCNWVLRAIYDGVLDTKLTPFTDEALFHLSGCISGKTIGNGVVLIRDKLLNCPFTIRKCDSVYSDIPLILDEFKEGICETITSTEISEVKLFSHIFKET